MALRAFGEALFGYQTGSGDPDVVALHGWGRDHHDFDRILRERRAIAFDLPGFGSSPSPPEAWSTAEYADALAGPLAELTPPHVVVGHSFGGRVAVRLAARRPDLVSGLVLCGVPLLRSADPPSPPLSYRLARLANRIGVLSDDRMERLRRARGSADYRAAEGVMRDVLVKAVNEDYADALSSIDCPVVYVWGGDDTAAPPAIAERASTLTRSTLSVHTHPHVGHLLPTERPDLLAAALDEVVAAT